MASGTGSETLVDLFERSIRLYGPRALFGTKRAGGWSWTTYAAFGASVERTHAGLAAAGVRRGDRVVMIANNRVEWAETAYACYRAGAVFVPMYEAQNVKDWEFIIADCEAKVVVVASGKILDKARSIASAVPSVEHVVVLDDGEAAAAGGPFGRAPVTTYAAFRAAGGSAPPAEKPSRDDLATLIYTSGTTGAPKGVMLSHHNIASNVDAIHEVLKLTGDDRSLAFLPWAHVFGQTAELHHLISAGASMAICESTEKILEYLGEVRPTLLFSVPTIFNRIYVAVKQQLAARPKLVQRLVDSALVVAAAKREGKPVGAWDRARLALVDRIVFQKVRARFGGRLRYSSAGGAALSREVAEFMDSLGITVFEGYGLTETSPVVSTNYPGVRKIGTVGPPVPGVRVVIDAGEGGTEGEIVVFGPNVMKGYYRRPEETAAVMTPDGGFRTGDMGCLDADGFLAITGRIKEQYKLENGKYVVPTSLEDQLKLSPFVANVMVYGDNKPHNVALVVVNVDAVRKWAGERKVDLPGDTPALLADDRVRTLLREEIARCGAGFKGFEVVRDFELLSEPFTIDNGLLTPKLSVRRRKVVERYQGAIDKLYARRSRPVASSAA